MESEGFYFVDGVAINGVSGGPACSNSMEWPEVGDSFVATKGKIDWWGHKRSHRGLALLGDDGESILIDHRKNETHKFI